MGTSAIPALTSEAGVSAVAPVVPAPTALQAATAAARDVLAKQAAAAQATVDAAAVIEPAAEPEVVVPVEETEEQRLDRIAREAAGEVIEEPPSTELSVTIDGAREGESVTIEVSDLETADRLRQLQRAAVRGHQARAIRMEGQQAREDAEEINYRAEVDPAGVLTENIKSPKDQGHLLRYLLTRPNVLAQNEKWLVDLLNAEDPAVAVASEARMAEAERIERREAVGQQVAWQRELNKNARALVQATERSIDSLVPETWTDEMKGQLYEDVLEDVRKQNRQRAAEAEQRGIPYDGRQDPRTVAGMVQRRLKLLGVAPKAVQPVGAGKAPVGTTPPVKTVQTPETLRAARSARQAAASAPVGAGSPAAIMPKAPAYDPTQKGNPIQQAAAHARRFVSALRKPT